MSDRAQSREALRNAGRKFEQRLVEAIASRERGWYTLRVKLDRGKVMEIQRQDQIDEPTNGFKINPDVDAPEDTLPEDGDENS